LSILNENRPVSDLVSDKAFQQSAASFLKNCCTCYDTGDSAKPQLSENASFDLYQLGEMTGNTDSVSHKGP
jgi:hypothetical protein